MLKSDVIDVWVLISDINKRCHDWYSLNWSLVATISKPHVLLWKHVAFYLVRSFLCDCTTVLFQQLDCLQYKTLPVAYLRLPSIKETATLNCPPSVKISFCCCMTRQTTYFEDSVALQVLYVSLQQMIKLLTSTVITHCQYISVRLSFVGLIDLQNWDSY